MPYEYTSKEELEQDIQEVKNMLVDVEQKMQLTNTFFIASVTCFSVLLQTK